MCDRLGAHQDDACTNCMRQSQDRHQRQSKDEPQEGLDNPLADIADHDGLQSTAGSYCDWNSTILGACAPAELFQRCVQLRVTFGDMKTCLNASGRRFTPTANMRKPRPGAYIPGVNLDSMSGQHNEGTSYWVGVS